jgi:uncharacterized membrane protein YvlD (DUF360 family)
MGRLGFAGAWQAEQYRTQRELYIGGIPARHLEARLDTIHAPVDARGVFASLASLVVLLATFLPWYAITPAPRPPLLGSQLTIVDLGYGGWRWAIPAVAVAALVLGVVDALIRPAQRFAVLSFFALRVLVLALLGLVIAAVVVHTPHHVLGVSNAVGTVRWPAWGALAAAVVGFGSSLAAAPRSD